MKINNKQNSLGQYFTPPHVADFMIHLADIAKNASVLDPCSGEGVFLKRLNHWGYSNCEGYEVDHELQVSKELRITFESFVDANIEKQYDLIIGNPPYIRWKNLHPELKDALKDNLLWRNYFNSLCDYLYIFILKSIQLLKNGGQLIFITPEYWMNTKHSITLRNYMVDNGYLESLYHFNEAPIFNSIASSIIIFKYIKDIHTKKKPDIHLVKYSGRGKVDNELLDAICKRKNIDGVMSIATHQFSQNEAWTLVDKATCEKLECFENQCLKNEFFFHDSVRQGYFTLKDIAEIGNGMVSGLDKAFQIPVGYELNSRERTSTIKVLKAKNINPFIHGETTNYIFVNENIENEEIFRERYPNFHRLLADFKEQLNKRYNYARKIQYWEWVFLRNYKLFSKNQERVFIPCKERISHKDYFRFCYVEKNVFPTQDVTAIFLKPHIKESIYYILAYLNNYRVFEWLKHKGVVKGNIVEFSEKPLNSIPVRLINWKNEKEAEIHKKITASCQQFIENQEKHNIAEINKSFDLLL